MSDEQAVTPNRRLGRGLSALLGSNTPAPIEQSGDQKAIGELSYLPISQVVRNPFQPRKHFEQESLGELAASIKEHGVIQPVIVRDFEGAYQLIAGERRWQAAQKAGLTTIPCRIVDVIDKTACEYALEENLKRKDLNDLE
ncbi:MAG: ParB/RepB/Spo0J family partition protein, partial [Planctomicrobium sp.]|nr:ParB/RepB/Spo0J family partition protein [Planctomicrobium sp.]